MDFLYPEEFPDGYVYTKGKLRIPRRPLLPPDVAAIGGLLNSFLAFV